MRFVAEEERDENDECGTMKNEAAGGEGLLARTRSWELNGQYLTRNIHFPREEGEYDER